MSSAPEVEIVAALNADAALTGEVGMFYLNQWPRNLKTPVVIVQAIGDSNTKRTLAAYGGELALQFDLYNKKDTPELRSTLKTALRSLRGTVGQLRHVWVVITNEINQGVDQAGVWRWTVDATVNWEEA